MNSIRSKRRVHRTEDPKLSMTSMIDVVFLLLVFFVVTVKPVDILAALAVSRPRPDDRPPSPIDEPFDLITIEVHPRGYSVNESWIGFDEMRGKLRQLGRYSTNSGVVVICYMDSTHAQLVRVLDLCAEIGFHNLSVMTR